MDKNKNERPVIVVFLGHVDHGKTTLLDAIRKTNVAGGEAGGITQSIGASVVQTKEGRSITFIDTPGHAAFSQMRANGAKIADIGVLVVALDDGVKPQTREALDYIKETNLPFIVAATKSDLATANPATLKNQLEKEEVKLEGRGGDTPFISVSAKKGAGVTDLIDLILLVSEVNGVKGDEKDPLQAYVVETRKDKRGLLASVVLKSGKLHVGEKVFAKNTEVKIRALFNFENKSVKEVVAGEPALVLGFSSLPEVGSRITSEQEQVARNQTIPGIRKAVKLGKDEIPIILKAKTAGALEALTTNLPGKVVIIEKGVGDVNESDVFLAKADNRTMIYAFESEVSSAVKKLAETEGVEIKRFDIIYKLFEDLDELTKTKKPVILGKAKILQSFPFDNKKVAGSKVMSGRVSKGDNLKIERAKRLVGKVKATSLRKGKENVDTVKEGEEFGVIFEPQLDFMVGDVIVSER